jgi:predicted nucleotidyltransferase component of viral defense system
MSPDDLDTAELTSAQRALLAALGRSDLSSAFYLSGGTAIAGFYLHHRVSRDLDLFTDQDVPLEPLRAFLSSVPGAQVKGFQRLFDRRIFLLEIDGEPLELEFTRYPFARAGTLVRLPSQLAIDDPRDLVANKLAALADRREPKDEIDLYFLMRAGAVASFEEAIALAERKFGIPGLRYILQRRMMVLSATHPATRPPVARDELERFFHAAARTLVAADVDE